MAYDLHKNLRHRICVSWLGFLTAVLQFIALQRCCQTIQVRAAQIPYKFVNLWLENYSLTACMLKHVHVNSHRGEIRYAIHVLENITHDFEAFNFDAFSGFMILLY